jgi:predicted protein tyrosine phosphatase
MDPMIANTLLLSESRALAWLLSHPASALLSIRDTDECTGRLLPCEVLGPRLDLRFDDVSRSNAGNWQRHLPPSRADARAIVAFARALQAAPWPAGLVVHCAAGVSRSAAALVGVARVWTGSDAAAIELLRGVERRTRSLGLRTHDPLPNLRLIALLDRELALAGSLVRALLAASPRLLMASASTAEEAIADALLAAG